MRNFKLLDQYIGKQLLDYCFLGISVFTLVMFFSDTLLDFMKDIQHYGIPWDIALTIIGLQFPKIITMVIPMSVLLATLMVYSSLNGQFELIAMRMTGVSLYRLALPAFMLGAVASVFCYVINDYIVPACSKDAKSLKLYAIAQQSLPPGQKNFIYKQFDENQQLKRLIYIADVGRSKIGVSTWVDLTTPDTLQVTQAMAGTWGNASMQLHDASVYTVSSSGKVINTTRAKHLVLQNFIQPQGNITRYTPREMTFLQLSRWLQVAEAHHKKIPRKVYINLWEKLTLPLSALPLVWIAVPLAITAPRNASNRGVLLAVLILFGYYLLRHLSVQLGVNTPTPPIVAAFLPLIILTAIAMGLFRKKNRVL